MASQLSEWYRSTITAVKPDSEAEGDASAYVRFQIALTGGWLAVPRAIVTPRVGDPVYWRGSRLCCQHLVIGECEVWNELD